MKSLLTIYFIFIFLINLPAFSQNSWQWVNPKPDNLLVVDKSFPNNMTGYILCQSDIIRKTIDGGNNWITIYEGNSNLIRSISAPDVDHLFAAGNNNTFIKTTDGGQSWNQISIDTNNQSIIDLFFLDNNTGFISVIVHGGNNSYLYKTTNSGLSWTQVLTTGYAVTHIVFKNQTTGYAFYPFRIYKTTDSGLNWTYYNNPYYFPNAVEFTNSETGYLATARGVIKTTNGGVSFFQLNIGAAKNDTTIYDIYFINESTGFANSKKKIFRTTNSGSNWTSFNVTPFDEFENGENGKIYFNQLGEGYIFNIRGVIFNSTNSGETWNRFTTGFTHDILLMDILDSSRIYIIASDEDEFSNDYIFFMKSLDQGNNWIKYNLDYIPDKYFEKIKFLNPNIGFLNAIDKLYGTLSGSSWDVNFNNSEYIMDFDFLPIDSIYVTGYLIDLFSKLYKTNNAGYNWSLLTTVQNSVFPYKLKFVNNNTGFICDNDGIMKSTNGGISWFRIFNTNALKSLSEGDKIHFLDANNIYAFGGSILYKSTNGGSTWQFLPNPCESVSFAEVKNHVCYIWGSVGNPDSKFFKSTDGGHTWQNFVIGIDRSINGMKFLNENTGYIYGENGTLLRTTNGGTTFINNISSSIPKGFNLYQNYPNPFNPSTKIKFDIHISGRVELIMYDITGRKVTDLINDELRAGSYEVIFNAQNLSSGIYIYTLKTSDFISSKKMIFIK